VEGLEGSVDEGDEAAEGTEQDDVGGRLGAATCR